MNPKYRVFTTFFAGLVSIVTAVALNEPAFLWVVAILYGFGILYRNSSRELYFFSLSINIIFGCLLIYVFQSSNNSFFDTGGDDAKYFNYFNQLSQGNEVYRRVRYGNFILLGSTFIDILKIFGISNPSPVLVYPLNWFFGANVCGLTYILGRQLGVDKVGAYFSSVLLSVYPYFVLHETKMLREILVTLVVLLFFVCYYSKINIYLKALIGVLIGLFFIKLRSEFVLYLLFFVFVDILILMVYKKQRMLIFLFLALAVLILGFGYTYILQVTGRDAEDLGKFSQAYSELRANNVDGSLGSALKNAGGIFKIVTWFYIWISPFPPPAFQIFNIIYVLVSIGAIFWYRAYLKFPVILFSYLSNVSNDSLLKRNTLTMLVFVSGASLIIALTTADSRHLISFYPIVFLSYYIVNKSYPVRKMVNLNRIAWGFSILLFVLYAVIKFA